MEGRLADITGSPEQGPSVGVQNDARAWNEAVVIIRILSVILLLLITALLSGGMSRQYRVIAEERARHLDMMEREFEEKDEVFEPFFTTKKPGRVTGLGVTVNYGSVTGL